MSVHTRKLPGDGNVRPGTVFFTEVPTVLPSGPQASPEAREPEVEVAAPPLETPRTRRGDVATARTNEAADLPWYRRERWLAVQLVALIPILGAMLVPVQYRVPLCILGGVLVAIGTVMMLRHDPTGAAPKGSAGAGSS
jgi:hypothetical protein